MTLSALADALAAAGLVQDPQVDEGFVHGDAVVVATGAEVTLNVDPDPDEVGLAVDVESLVARSRTLVEVSRENHDRVVDEVASELEAALAEEQIEQVSDLRTDLTLVSLIALPDGGALILMAPEQFPNGAITVFVDDAWTVTEIQLEGLEGGGCTDCDCGSEHGSDHSGEAPELSFTSMDDLLDTLSQEK